MTHWIDRVAPRSVREGDCVLFSGAKATNGYCIVWAGNKYESLHRLSYKHFKGEIPRGLIVRHTCDTRHCWNPEHLVLGTHKDNMADKYERGRAVHYCNEAHHLTRLSNEQIAEIRRLATTRVLTQAEIGKRFGISQGYVSEIKRGEYRTGI